MKSVIIACEGTEVRKLPPLEPELCDACSELVLKGYRETTVINVVASAIMYGMLQVPDIVDILKKDDGLTMLSFMVINRCPSAKSAPAFRDMRKVGYDE